LQKREVRDDVASIAASVAATETTTIAQVAALDAPSGAEGT